VSAINQIDPLSNLLALPGVAKECELTLKAIDDLMWNRTVRRHQSALTPYTRRIAGFATAALDGAQMPKDPTMEPEVSPMGSLSEQGLLLTAEADLQTLAFKTEPLKVIARLHTLRQMTVIGGSLEQVMTLTTHCALVTCHLTKCYKKDLLRWLI